MGTPTGFDWSKLIGPAISAAGAGLSGYQQGKQSKQDRAQRATENAQQNYLRGLEMQQGAYSNQAGAEGGLYSQWLQDQFNRSNAVQNARGIGEAQGFESKNAMASAMFPALYKRANSPMMPSDPAIAKLMPKSAGFQIDPAAMSRLMNSWSPGATAQSIAQRDMDIQSLANGSAAGTQGLMGQLYGQGASPLMNQMTDWSSNLYNTATGERTSATNTIRNALAQNIQGSTNYVEQAQKDIEEAKKKEEEAQKGGGIGGFLGNVLPIAAMAIPGLGPLAMAAKVGIGAASGALRGGGIKGAILGGAGAGIGGLAGAGKIPGLDKIANPVLRGAVTSGLGGMGGGIGGMLAGAGMGALGGYGQQQQQRRNNASIQQLPAVQEGMPSQMPGTQSNMGALAPPDIQGRLPNLGAGMRFANPGNNLTRGMNNPYAMNFAGRRQ